MRSGHQPEAADLGGEEGVEDEDDGLGTRVKVQLLGTQSKRRGEGRRRRSGMRGGPSERSMFKENGLNRTARTALNTKAPTRGTERNRMIQRIQQISQALAK